MFSAKVKKHQPTSMEETACASFAGGFVPIDTEVVVTVNNGEQNIAMLKTSAQAAPASPRDAVVAIAEAYNIAVDDVRATVYVVVGGADGNKL